MNQHLNEPTISEDSFVRQERMRLLSREECLRTYLTIFEPSMIAAIRQGSREKLWVASIPPTDNSNVRLAGSLRIRDKFFSDSRISHSTLLGAEYFSGSANGNLSILRQNNEGRLDLEARIKELEQINARLEGLVNADPLTGLLNRRGLQTIFARETAYAKRTRTTPIAALLDLDNFKAFNDNYGYEVGDKVLKAVAKSIKEGIRGSDWCGRVGGDEFLVLLPSTCLSDGFAVLDRLRMTISKKTVVAVFPDELLHMTVSIGLAALESDITTIEDILRVTGSSLRASKHSGKNRTTAQGCSGEEKSRSTASDDQSALNISPKKPNIKSQL